MGSTNTPTRQTIYLLRGDIAGGSPSTIQSSLVGGPAKTWALGTPVTAPIALNPPGDRVISVGHYCGPTSARPNAATDTDVASPPVGQVYFDQTLSKAIVFDGVSWRDPFTGGVV